MVLGIIMGAALTVLTVVLAMVFGKKKFTPLSYIIIVVALVAFSFEGIKFVNAIDDKIDVANKVNNMAAIAETAVAYTGSDVQNYRLGIAEATAVKTALRFAYPKAANYLETSDLMGKTLFESTEVLKNCIIRSANSRIWESVLWMAGILVTVILLIVLSTNIGSGSRRKKASIISCDDSYTPSHCDDF